MTSLAALLPEHLALWLFADQRPEWLLWLVACGAIGLLVLGANWTVSSAVRLATALGMSTVIIGATVVSLGTTSPEAAVSVAAALKHNPGLALGNGVGSIICDTALIFGLCCLLAPLPIDRFVLNRHGWLQFGAGALLTGTVLILWALAGDMEAVQIPRPVGLLFLALLVGYLVLSARWARRHPELIPDEARAAPLARNPLLRVALSLGVLAAGLALVVGGSELLIGSVTGICQRRGVPEAVLAVTLVAFGTSLPELVTALASIIKKHPELLVGNIIGADILNVLFVIGASAAAVPLKVDRVFFVLLLPAMMIVLGMFRLFIFTSGKTFRRWHGVPLLLSYVVVMAILVLKFGISRL